MDVQAVQDFVFPDIVHDYARKDSILYALGLGYGADPLAPEDLQFTYEQGLKAAPAMVNVLAHPGFWVKAPELRLDWRRLLHGSQRFEILRPLPTEGRAIGRHRVTAVEDLGPEKGARLYLRKDLLDGEGELLARVRSTYMLRGDGGCGGFGAPEPQPEAAPEGAPDRIVTLGTLPQQALLYRLSGDWNPLHASPEAAAAAGFARPILHGLCSLGLATRALIQAAAPREPERLSHFSLRFSRPVLPGDSLTVEIHDLGGGEYRFRARVPERGEVVLDRGKAVFAPALEERPAEAARALTESGR